MPDQTSLMEKHVLCYCLFDSLLSSRFVQAALIYAFSRALASLRANNWADITCLSLGLVSSLAFPEASSKFAILLFVPIWRPWEDLCGWVGLFQGQDGDEEELKAQNKNK